MPARRALGELTAARDHSHSHSHLAEYTMSEILNDLSAVPDGALDAVLLKSVEMPEGTPTVRGYDFEGPLDLQKMLDCMMTSGYQATQFGRCVDEVNRMLKWRLSDEPVDDTTDEDERDPAYRASTRTKIFLGFTSNLISSGVREQLRYLVKTK